MAIAGASNARQRCWRGSGIPELAEYEGLPEAKPYLEYVDGEVIQKPVPKRPHWKLQTALAHDLFRFGLEYGGSAGTEPHVYFVGRGRTVVRVPDVACWAPGKPEGDDDRTLPPTLAAEIEAVVPSSYDKRAKCRFMVECGVDVCWLIDPDARTVEVFAGGTETTLAGDAVLESSHLPGFSLALVHLFARIGGA